MSKIQCILFLFILLIVIISMGIMFSVKETFVGGAGKGPLGKKLSHPMNANPNCRNGNVGYESMAYIGLVYPPHQYKVSSEDQPLSYGFI